MKKMIIVLAVALFVIGLTACGGGKYADVKDVMGKMIVANEKFIAAVEKVENVDDAVVVIEEYANALKGLMPKMMELAGKYPEFQDKTKMPEELKEINVKGEETTKKMQAAMQKLSQTYGQDPKFQGAMMKMAGSMAGK